jgi:hypothetical protein
MSQKVYISGNKVNVQSNCISSTRILNQIIVVIDASTEQDSSRLNIVGQHAERFGHEIKAGGKRSACIVG